MRKLRNKKGFTLVELMIVVAIIGILSAIAIPNFQKYQAKSRTTEAKIALSNLFTAEKSWFAEWNFYTRCSKIAGFLPEGARRFYLVGFTAGISSTVSAQGAPGCANNTVNVTYYAANESYGGEGVPLGASVTSATTTNSTFTATAIGHIFDTAQADTANDEWTIDEDRLLTHFGVGY